MPKKKTRIENRLNHLKKALKHLRTNTYVANISEFQRLICAFSESLDHLPSRGKWEKDLPKLEIPIDSSYSKHHNPSLLIGGVIRGDGPTITYSSLSVCLIHSTDDSYQKTASDSCCLNSFRKTKRIVRRFHFDFQPESTKHPCSHIQYGGNIPSEYSDFHYCVEDIDNPRIHYFPIDVVLLLDMFLKEFPTPLKPLTSENNWRGLVFESQELWWKEYVDTLKDCLNNSQGKTFHELVYCGSI